MKPLNKTLMTSAAALMLVAGSAFAQDTSIESDTDVSGDLATESTTMNSDTSSSTDMETDDEELTAQSETETETELEADLETAADETGEAIEDTAEDVADATEDAAEDMEEGAEEMTAEAEAEIEGEMESASMDSDLEAAADLEIASLIGTPVISQEGNDVGEVDNFVEMDSKIWAVIGVGGFLGIGEQDVAVDLEHLAVGETDDEGNVTEFMLTGYSEADLEQMEEFDAETATVIDTSSSLRAEMGS
jgi:ribosomal 30S subunit maturation factor RimM